MIKINKMKQSFAIFLIFTLIFAMFPGAIGAEEASEDKDYSGSVEEAIENAVDYMKDKGVETEWEAIGISRAGYEVPESYNEVFHENLKEQVTNSRLAKITDIEKFAMAAQLIALDPKEIDEINLIEKIYNSANNPREVDTMTRQGNNGPIFALIALDSGGYSVPEDALWNRAKLIDYLLSKQLDDGGWPLAGTKEDIDITSMAIIALSNYTENTNVKQAIDQAVSFLSEAQGDEGGFHVDLHGGVSVESSAQAIIGLTSVGIDPLGEDFTKSGINLLDHLLGFVADDGGFTHLKEDDISNSMATEQALQALIAYKLYSNNDGKLYDFGKKESPDPEPDPDPEPEPEPEPELEPEPSDEEPIELEVDKKVDVSSGDVVNVKGSKTKIALPDDLPEGTKLTITNPDAEKYPYNDSELELAGDWFNFEFKGSEDYQGTYELILGVNDTVDISKAGVYHFNERNQLWEFIKGKVDNENRTITVTVDHFSIYGVFIKDEAEEGHETGDDDNKEPSEGNDETPKGEDDTDLTDDDDKTPGNDEVIVEIEDENLTTVPKKNKNENKNETITNAQKEDGQKLPKTATNSYNFMFIGMLMLLLGLILFVIRRTLVLKK